MMTREEFKRYAAGTFVIGKSSFDHKMLEAYMDGALNAWDMFNKQKKQLKTNLNKAPLTTKNLMIA
jgi:hypothetical protein